MKEERISERKNRNSEVTQFEGGKKNNEQE